MRNRTNMVTMSSSTRSPSKSTASDLSPELSERLKPDHRHNRDHHDFHRRRHHRRPNKRGRRHPWHHSSRPRSPPEPQRSSRPRSRSPGSSGGADRGSDRGTDRNSPMKNGPKGVKKNLVLRPTKGPLLNAPKNSTQFIIDDHEPFLDTEVSPKKYNTRSRSCSSSRRVSASEAGSPGSPEKHSSKDAVSSSTRDDCQATPGNYVVNDDDYTYWAEYNERDFQSVYESAHQEQVADWDRSRLIEEISNLEKRQKELVGVLAKVDPEMYAQRLESQLQALQEKNRQLRNENGLEQHLSPSQPMLEEANENNVENTKSPRESPDSSTK